MDADLAREAGALYELPASEFTAARNARAKRLRAERPELAAAVAALPKPTVAAAAVNRIAHDEPSEVRALIQAGKRLREAQERAVAGTTGAALQEAVAEHREALERVRREARRLKLSGPVLDRVSATLRAASVDPELQPLLERGLLAHELEPAGFGLDAMATAAAPKQRQARPSPRGDAAKKQRAQVETARADLARAKRDRTSAARVRREAGQALEQAEAALARAEAAVRRAEQALERARKA